MDKLKLPFLYNHPVFRKHLLVNLTFGPFFVSNKKTGAPCAEIVPAGFDVEYASPDLKLIFPVYRKAHSWAPDRCQFEELLVFEKDLPPWDFSYVPLYGARTALGEFIPFEAVLCSFVTQGKTTRSLDAMLAEVRDHWPVNNSQRSGDSSGMLAPEIEADGYRMSGLHSYGRTVSVEIGWLFPQDRTPPEGGPSIHVCQTEFRPRPDGSLGEGKWYAPRNFPTWIMLFEQLRKKFPCSPFGALTEEGRNQALAEFTWTPLAKMTAKEARLARIEFIRKNPELMESPRLLAESLQRAGLYAKSTTVHQILKFLPQLIAAA